MEILPFLKLAAVLSVLLTHVHLVNSQSTATCLHSCQCHGHILKCDCDSYPTGAVNTLTILPNSLAVAPTELIIRNCRKVDFYPWSMYTSVALKKIEISNVQDLNLYNNAFLGTENATSVVIRNSAITTLLSDSLGHIEGIHRIELDNVTIAEVSEGAFAGLVHVAHLRIANSKFGVVKSQAFPDSIKDMDNFAMVNTSIESMESGAFQMENVANITWKHVTIEKWHSNAFAPTSVRHVSIRYSNISELHENAFSVQNVEDLSVLHNRIKELYPKAFGAIKNVNKFEFSNNIIYDVKRGVLFGYDNGAVAQADIVHNRFECNTALCWLLRDDKGTFANATVLENSICYGPRQLAGKTFPEVNSLHDDEDFCDDGAGDFEGSGRSAGLDVPLFESETPSSPVSVSITEDGQVTTLITPQYDIRVADSHNHSNQNDFSICLIFVLLYSMWV